MTHPFPDRMDLSVALKRYRNAGDVIQLHQGRYTFRGTWDFEQFGWVALAGGVTLDATDCEIVLENPFGVDRPQRDIHLAWLGTGSKIIGGTWNLNREGNVGLNLRGFHALGPVELHGLTLVGQRGDRGAGVESFALTQEGDAGGTIIRDCVSATDVTDPNDYVSGWYPGGTAPASGPILVDACSARYGPKGWFAFSSTQHTRFQDCHGDAAHWWYTDTGDGLAEIVRPTGTGHYAFVGCRQAGRRQVTVLNGTIAGHRAVEWGFGADNGGVLFSRCKIDSEFDAAIDATHGFIGFAGCESGKKVHRTAGSFEPVYV